VLTFVDGQEAVFLPGKIHGCDWQIYILYYNSCANNHNGCWEIEILDAERILALNDNYRGFKLKYSGTTVTLTIGNGSGSITNVYGVN